jgi:ferredoxin
MIRIQKVNSMVKNIIMIVSLLPFSSSSFMMITRTRPSQCGVVTPTLLRNTISEKSALSPQFMNMFSTSSSSSSLSASASSSTVSSTSIPTTTTTSQNKSNQPTPKSKPIPNQEKVTIHFKTKNQNKSISIQKGETLRTALMKRGISPHNGQSRLINCRGLGTCGTCAVEVKALGGALDMGAIQPKERTAMERIRLNFPPHGSEDQSCDLRLACQIQVYEDVQVTKKSGFWGHSSSKGDLAEEYDAKTYFGDLEYILDDKSPEGDTDETQS